MKRLLVLCIVFISGLLLASCQSQQLNTVQTEQKPKVVSPVEPSASPAATSDEAAEVTAIQDEIKKIDLKADFQTFTDKDLLQ